MWRPLARSARATVCSANALVISVRSLASGTTAIIGQPLSLDVQAVDNCGNPLTAQAGGAIKASFSNGDPSLNLTNAVPGIWQATWIPSSGQGSVIITFTAFARSLTGGIFGTQIDVVVTIQPSSAPPFLVVPSSLSFNTSQGVQSVSQQVVMSYLRAQTASLRPPTASWLERLAAKRKLESGAGILTVTAIQADAPGTYTGFVTIQSPGLTIPPDNRHTSCEPRPTIILLSQAGLSFTAAQGGGAPLPQDFGILNIGRNVMNWTVSSSTKWLSVTPSSGAVNRPYLDVSLVNVAADPTGLSAGTYYGQIKVSATSTGNSPQSISVVLTILPAGTNPGPEVRPTGLIFAGPQNAALSPQQVMVANTSTKPSVFTTSSASFNGPWFSLHADYHQRRAGKTRAASPSRDLSSLSPGPTRGLVTLLFDDGSTSNIALSLRHPASATQSLASLRQPRRRGCTPSQLNMQPSGSQLTFSIREPVTVKSGSWTIALQPLTASTPNASVRGSY